VTGHAPLSGARTAAIGALGDSIVGYRRTLASETGFAPQPAVPSSVTSVTAGAAGKPRL
jgi:hypothetical protein